MYIDNRFHLFGKDEYDRRVAMYMSRNFTKDALCTLIFNEHRRIHGRELNPRKALMRDNKGVLVHRLVRLQRAKLQPIKDYGF